MIDHVTMCTYNVRKKSDIRQLCLQDVQILWCLQEVQTPLTLPAGWKSCEGDGVAVMVPEEWPCAVVQGPDRSVACVAQGITIVSVHFICTYSVINGRIGAMDQKITGQTMCGY